MKKFKMKRKPIKPSRRDSVPRTVHRCEEGTIRDLLDKIRKEYPELTPEDFILSPCWDHSGCIEAEFQSPETDEEFKVRRDLYQKELEKWEEWAKDHEREIRLSKEADLQRLKKQAARIQKSIADLS
jgi:hypothetical protein